MRGFGIAALAVAGLLFAWTPWPEPVDAFLYDAQVAFLRQHHRKPAPDDIVIVGIDEATLRAIPEPLGLWHEPLGRVIGKIAGAGPKAIGLDIPLPERSLDAVRPGMDRALLAGLHVARARAPLVAALQIDPRTRTARPIFAPFLAVIGDQGLGLDLHARDSDHVVRRFALGIPTEDGNFPTFTGRLCRSLSKACRDGFIDYALGKPFRFVAFHEMLASQDPAYVERLFKGQIVLLGEVPRFVGRLDVPANLAGWEAVAGSSPSIVVYAAALRTALHGHPAQPAGKPVVFLLVTLAALVILIRDARLIGVASLLAAFLLLAVATVSLHHGRQLPIAPALATLVFACLIRAVFALRARFRVVRRA